MSTASSSIAVSAPAARRPVLPMIVLGLLAIGMCVLRYAIDRVPGGAVSLAWPEPDWAMFRRTSIFAGIIVGGGWVSPARSCSRCFAIRSRLPTSWV